MALEVRPLDCRLQIQFDVGAAPNGRRIVRTKTLNRIKSGSADQELFDVANALVGLQSHSPIAVRRISQSEFAAI